MSQGICLFDADKKLVICNQRFRDMYHFTEGEVGPGTSLESILRRLAGNGETSDLTIEEHLVSLPGRNDEVFRRADGSVIAIRRCPTPDGGWVATHEDITEREQANRRISHLAYHDVLTGLANRAQFKKQGEAALARAAARAGGAISVLLVDLDRFKAVNDTFGHTAGDEVLLAAAERMRQSVRTSDVIARLGGDEFAVVQQAGGDQREAAIALASRLVDVLGAPFEVNGHQAMIGASIGIAVQSDADDTIEQLMHKADLALYRVKAAGRNGYCVYEEDLGIKERERKLLGGELRSALAAGALDVRYEPIVSLPDQRVCGMEARARWVHPERGPLDGKDFRQVAEEAGLTTALGEFILHRACLDAGRWPERVKLTVNIERAHVRKRTLMDTVTRALLKARMAPERLDIAITETNLLQDDEDVLAELHQLRSLGVSVVIDGYGAGNSSLNHLRIFPFDRIKIDRTMVAEITERPESAAIVCAVTGLARSLDISTTAEGVTTDEQLRMLQAAGCSQAQGGLFGSPGTATETLSRLLIENALPAQQRLA
jgi:diguanylate cyclase (GGDEF)-like protein